MRTEIVRLTVTVEEAGALLGVSRTTAYELASTGELPTLRLRRRLVVPRAALAGLLGLAVADISSAVVPSTPPQR